MPHLPRADLRTRRTRSALTQALTDLLAETPFEAVSIAQVAALAGVTKTTVFRHYRDKHDLLQGAAERRVPELVQALAAAARAGDRGGAALSLCRFVEDNRPVMAPLLASGPVAEAWLREVVLQVAAQLPPDFPRPALDASYDLLLAHASGGVVNLLAWWVSAPAPTSATEMARIVDQWVLKGLCPDDGRDAPAAADTADVVPPPPPPRMTGGGLCLAESAVTVALEQIEGFDNPTRQRLIIAGERMLGSEGFDGVALHKIAAAAGQANTYSVQYHFGNLDGLIDAILEARLRAVGARRKTLMESAEAKGLLKHVPAMLEVIFLPMAEQVSADGRHSYARFWLQYFVRRGFHQPSDLRLRPQSDLLGEPVARLLQLLGLEWDELVARLAPLNFMLYAALLDRDSLMQAGQAPPPLERVVGRCIAMMDAALRVPLPPPTDTAS